MARCVMATEVVTTSRLLVTWPVPRDTAAASAHVLYTHTTLHKFTVSSYSKPHTSGACIFSCNLPSALSAE